MADTKGNLDRFDRHVVEALQADAWQSIEKIAEKTHKSPSAVSRRIKDLQEVKVITGCAVKLDPVKLGLKTTVYTLVLLKSHGDGMTDKFEREVAGIPYVVECARISSSWDYLLKFMVRDTQHHDQLHNKLLSLPMVSRVRGMHVIGQPKAKPLPIEQGAGE